MKDQALNLIVLANGERGLKLISDLNQSDYQISAVICPCKSYQYFKNEKLNSNLYKENDVNSFEFIEQLKVLNPDIIIVAGFSTILKKDFISIPKIGIINLHAGTLPKYRGGSPLNWQLINGEEYAGLSVILLDQGIDTGNILSEDKIKIEDNDNIKILHQKANNIFPKLTFKALKKLEQGNKGTKQDNNFAIYWHQRSDEDGYINFANMCSRDINNTVRALYPIYPSSWTLYNGSKLRIRKTSSPPFKIKGKSGKVIFIQGKGPYIICKDHAILIEDYYLENSIDFRLKNGMQMK
tara:strand:- start:547 stop:1434 length:888 start_codon:yes stop_codon:yes gene_type:complete